MNHNDTYPEVSIILPTYNRAEYIVDAINSVRTQTYTNWKLLIIDDCSTDNTVELVQEIHDSRIRLHQTNVRVGVTATRNVGLRNTTGELIAFIDSDDLWAPQKLEKQVAAMSQYSDAVFCLTGGYNFRTLGEPVEYFYKERNGMRHDDLFQAFFKAEVSATTPSFMFRKHCLDVVGPFNENKSFADADFFLRVARLGKGIVLYEPLFFRRLHDSNLSVRNWESGYREGIELIIAYKHLLPSTLTRAALFKLYVNGGEKYLQRKMKKNAMRNFLKAWKQKPLDITTYRKMIKTLVS